MIGNSQEDGKATIRNVPAGSCKAWAFDRDNEVEYADEDWMSHNAGIGMDVTIATGSGGQVTLVRRSLQQ
jgi:hypothetical protein